MSEAPGSTAPAAVPAKRAAGRGRSVELSEELKAYKGVWVFVEHDRGHVHSVSWELVGEARKLADKLGCQVSALLLGGPDEALEKFAAEAFTFGADKAYIVKDPILKGYRNEPFTKGLTDLVNKYQPEILLLGATSMGRDLAGSVATTLLTGLTSLVHQAGVPGVECADTASEHKPGLASGGYRCQDLFGYRPGNSSLSFCPVSPAPTMSPVRCASNNSARSLTRGPVVNTFGLSRGYKWTPLLYLGGTAQVSSATLWTMEDTSEGTQR